MKAEIITRQAEPATRTSDTGGKPTLVFDAGMGNWSLFFHPLVQALRAYSKVCLIARDGYLDTNPAGRDGFAIARQLKETLEIHEIHEPIILGGHSLGGLHARIFQHMFPDKVKGMILLDAAHPYMPDHLPGVRDNLQRQIRMTGILKILAGFGLLRLAKRHIPTFGLPPSLHDAYYQVTTRPQYYSAYRKEIMAFEATLAASQALGDLGDLPLLVVSSRYGLQFPVLRDAAGEPVEDKVWLRLQEGLSALSTNSAFVKSNGDHFLHLTDTLFVAGAIRAFCEKNEF